jgi:hypothetical protein
MFVFTLMAVLIVLLAGANGNVLVVSPSTRGSAMTIARGEPDDPPVETTVVAEAAGEKSAGGATSRRVGRIVLLLAFGDEDGPAAVDLERSFLYATRQTTPGLTCDVVHGESPSQTALLCDSLFKKDGPKLVVFAGDEGSAAVAALKAAAARVPVLKLTSDSRSLTRLSPTLVEFLPSVEAQAEALAEFSVHNLHIGGAMVLCPEDLRGRASSDGFRRGLEAGGRLMDAARFYSADAASIRGDIAETFAKATRVSRGESPLRSALSPAERAEAFGDSTQGEVLLTDRPPDSVAADTSALREGFFFALSSDRLDLYSGQLPVLPSGTILLGNSSWMDREALERHRPATEGMYIVVPLLPESQDSTALLIGYEQLKNGPVTAWELLGLDAGEYVGQVLNAGDGKQEVLKVLTSSPPFEGRAVTVDFRGGRENRAARVLHVVDGELNVVK